jgi:hypothetical protein
VTKAAEKGAALVPGRGARRGNVSALRHGVYSKRAELTPEAAELADGLMLRRIRSSWAGRALRKSPGS